LNEKTPAMRGFFVGTNTAIQTQIGCSAKCIFNIKITYVGI
jgi:hypothetical protein